MYFKGKLSIDPAQLTQIEKVSPDSGFKKLLFSISGGQMADKLEVETFKALNILQQIHSSLNQVGVDNIIRLTHDDIDIYHDKTGEKNDFNFAMDKYQIEIDESMSTYFKTLWMVLEHEDDTFKYLFEISINRSHKENEYPIVIAISGLLKEFDLQAGQSKEQLKDKMQAYFSSQEAYDSFITTKKLAFEQFLESIRFESMKHIRADDIKMDIHTRMVIQKDKKQKPIQTAEPANHGMPYGYFGFGDLLLYSWLWSEMSYDNNIHLSDMNLVTDGGEFISDIGAEGVDAADASILDYNEDFDTRMEDVDVGDMDLGGMDEIAGDESSKSWLDGVFEDNDFDFDFGDW
jgi:hypothetical protein